MTVAALFAHQGGWDEILFVLAPLILFAVLLLVARRRVDRMESGDRVTGDRTTGDQMTEVDDAERL